MGAAGFLYTEKERAKLAKNLGRSPVEHAVGRGLCPYCGHLEARWNSAPARDAPGEVEVRVVCSQCRRRAVLRLPRT